MYLFAYHAPENSYTPEQTKDYENSIYTLAEQWVKKDDKNNYQYNIDLIINKTKLQEEFMTRWWEVTKNKNLLAGYEMQPYMLMHDVLRMFSEYEWAFLIYDHGERRFVIREDDEDTLRHIIHKRTQTLQAINTQILPPNLKPIAKEYPRTKAKVMELLSDLQNRMKDFLRSKYPIMSLEECQKMAKDSGYLGNRYDVDEPPCILHLGIILHAMMNTYYGRILKETLFIMDHIYKAFIKQYLSDQQLPNQEKLENIIILMEFMYKNFLKLFDCVMYGIRMTFPSEVFTRFFWEYMEQVQPERRGE